MRQFLKNLLKPDPAPASAPAPETEGQVPPPDRFPEARALQKQGQLEQARQIYEAILVANPQHFGALHYLGVTLFQMGDASAAVEWINRAIAVDAAVADAYFNLGNIVRALNRHDAAIANYDQAIALKPDDAEAFNNRGIVQEQIGQNDAALASFARAIALRPAYLEALNNHITLLGKLKRYGEALKSCDQAMAVDSHYDYLFGMRLHNKIQICDWADFDATLAEFSRRLQNGERVSMPFTALAVTDSPALLQRCNEIWVADDCPASHELPPLSRYAKHDKIRLGYFSADLQEHATAYLMAELFERHDRDRFELYAFSFGPQSSDAMRHRLMRAFDHFIDVRERSDVDIARLARELEIDIALDLKGFTADCRTRIFAYRAAPVQINYLGYPNTMGASYIDYLIADDTLIPEQHRNSYSEKIIYLPDSYQVNDTKRVISDRKYSRAELGLPETGFVFCSFNNTFKITPAIFSCWMRLLHAVPGSVMWLLEDNPDARANLEMEAGRRQMDPRRLVFARRAPLAEHLARHRVADLFLDTLPCNAHTTTSDALWAGLPVLTCMGESFASRVAASLLRAAMLPELVTASLEDYEALALRLATQPETLHAVREKLDANRLTCPLFDVGRYTSHLENAYLQVHERHHAGLAPDHLHIGR